MTVTDLPDRSTVRALVAAEVRAEMGRAAMTQTALSLASAVNKSTLSRKLKAKDEADSFTVDELDRIAGALRVPITKFFATVGPLTPPDDDTSGAPTRARTWDLRIKSP